MILSGEARLMRIASKSLVSAPRSWKLGLIFPFAVVGSEQCAVCSQVRKDAGLAAHRPLPTAHYADAYCPLHLFEYRLRSHLRQLLLGLHQLHVETERLELTNQHVERFGQARRERRVALDDRLVDLRASRHIVRLRREQLLEDVRRPVGFERPDLHLAEPLAAEL